MLCLSRSRVLAKFQFAPTIVDVGRFSLVRGRLYHPEVSSVESTNLIVSARKAFEEKNVDDAYKLVPLLQENFDNHLASILGRTFIEKNPSVAWSIYEMHFDNRLKGENHEFNVRKEFVEALLKSSCSQENQVKHFQTVYSYAKSKGIAFSGFVLFNCIHRAMAIKEHFIVYTLALWYIEKNDVFSRFSFYKLCYFLPAKEAIDLYMKVRDRFDDSFFPDECCINVLFRKCLKLNLPLTLFKLYEDSVRYSLSLPSDFIVSMLRQLNRHDHTRNAYIVYKWYYSEYLMKNNCIVEDEIDAIIHSFASTAATPQDILCELKKDLLPFQRLETSASTGLLAKANLYGRLGLLHELNVDIERLDDQYLMLQFAQINFKYHQLDIVIKILNRLKHKNSDMIFVPEYIELLLRLYARLGDIAESSRLLELLKEKGIDILDKYYVYLLQSLIQHNALQENEKLPKLHCDIMRFIDCGKHLSTMSNMSMKLFVHLIDVLSRQEGKHAALVQLRECLDASSEANHWPKINLEVMLKQSSKEFCYLFDRLCYLAEKEDVGGESKKESELGEGRQMVDRFFSVLTKNTQHFNLYHMRCFFMYYQLSKKSISFIFKKMEEMTKQHAVDIPVDMLTKLLKMESNSANFGQDEDRVTCLAIVRLVEAKHRMTAPTSLLLEVVKVYCRDGQLEKAEKILRSLPSKTTVVHDMYGVLIKAHLRQSKQNVEAISQLIDEMTSMDFMMPTDILQLLVEYKYFDAITAAMVSDRIKKRVEKKKFQQDRQVNLLI